MRKKYHPLRWIIWGLAALFYFYEFFLRVAPSVIVPELMKAFHVRAATVGFMIAFYFYIYAPMQIPVGLLADKYGARKLLTFASLVCGIGGLLMGIANQVWIGGIARLLMGAGSAFAFVGMIYICTHWFPKKMWAALIGIGNSLGMLGAVIGQGPLRIAINAYGWRSVMLFLGFFGLLLALVVFLIVRNGPATPEESAPKQTDEIGIFKSLSIVAKTPQTWLSSIISMCYYATTATFAGLWGVSFLEKKYGLSGETAGFAISMIFVGWVISGPIIGFVSDRLNKRKPPIVIFTLLTFITLTPVIYFDISLPLSFALLLLTGLFSSAQLLNYSFSIEVNPIEVKGTAIAFTNFFTILGSAILQPLIGLFLELGWDKKLHMGVPVYSLSDYTRALSCFPILLLLSFFLALFLKDKPHPKDHIDLPI